MLVFTRRAGERIRVGEDIEITVVRIAPNAVRIGIEAPSGSVVVRRELTERRTASKPSSKPGVNDQDSPATG